MCPELSPAPSKSQPDAGRQVCLIRRHILARVTFVPLAKNVCRFSRRRGNLCPAAEKARRGKVAFIHYRRNMCRFPGARGKLCPRAGKSISRRPGKFTFIHYRRKMFRFSRRRGKLCPGTGKVISRRQGKVTFMHYRRKCVGFPGARGSCARRRKVLERGSGKVPEQGSGENVILSAPGEAVSRRWESCFPAPGKGHIHSLSKKNG